MTKTKFILRCAGYAVGKIAGLVLALWLVSCGQPLKNDYKPVYSDVIYRHSGITKRDTFLGYSRFVSAQDAMFYDKNSFYVEDEKHGVTFKCFDCDLLESKLIIKQRP